MTEYHITVQDKDGELVLTSQDLIKYTTKGNIIAAALMIRLCRFAFSQLSPQEAIQRRELYWQIAFPGPGILDCIEMISHAVREGRCLQNPTLHYHGTNPAKALVGSFLFEITYRHKTLIIWIDDTIFDDEFRAQVSYWQKCNENTEGYLEYLKYKASKVQQIMSFSDDILFHYMWK